MITASYTRKTILPGNVAGTITAPPSKSAMQRALVAALLSGVTCTLSNPGFSNDDRAVLHIIQQLGATVEWLSNGDLQIIAPRQLSPIAEEIHFGESGLASRMLTPIVALCSEKLLLTGEGSLPTRPMDFFDEVLPQLAVQIQSTEGKLPITIQGPLQPKNITIDGSLSSQFLTGLLMAFAAANADAAIQVKDLKSKPYIDLTLQIMEKFGMLLPENCQYKVFQFKSSVFDKPLSIHYQVEGDWSGGAFLLVAGAIAGPLTVQGLDPFSTQADKAILQAIADSGAFLSVQPNCIEISPNQQLNAFHFDATDCPDLFPPLVALAAYCEGTTVIEGVHRLTHKESNRALTLQSEFGKLGIKIELQDNLMLVYGNTGVKSTKVSSCNDHRIAMACAIAGIKADGPVLITDAAAVGKSYPNFYEHLVQMGVQVTE